ncbi:MAG TPA: protein kinase [Verrucomicrobiae bacterium]
MSQPETTTRPLKRCLICGQELPPTVPPSRCPHCLLQQGLADTAAAPQNDTPAVSEMRSGPALPQPGETFGHYRIGRLLGEGGMGAVFEAEDLDNGRRVALKVLGHRLDSPEARSRFFREGRLAASVNHPNSVYVFGTEDIAGVPVIAMELVAGGTLQDRVVRQGPMPVGETVDSGLQIIAGLEAAQQVGVLHRDIKPSNCFVETDGTVKIGDFGLSISTVVRTEPAITATGAFLGTPAFASPEQLRGDELTVRSDIYSVGVTLYFLLTGRHPFNAPDMIRLLATVLERKAESPAKWRPELPAGLCRIVLRCLEKQPEKRFRNYSELRKALLPYASTAPTPATLGLRLAAYIMDTALLALPVCLANALVNLISGSAQAGHVGLAEAIVTQFTAYDPSALLLHNICGMVLGLAYFTWLEGTWGASVGKRICGLRVARLDHTSPGWRRALVRALVITGAPSVVWLLGWNAAHTWASGISAQQLITGIGLLVLPTRLAIFVTARPRNGYAGIHDLVSATRVVLKSAYQARPVLQPASEGSPELKTLPLIGPYHVLDRMGRQNGTELLLGFDARLLRRVWIRTQTPGAPPTPESLRQLSRPGRLRWLTARRANTEAWDAFEAASGQPLLHIIAQPQEWGRVRFWLLDLAQELLAATRDGTVPATLSLERVWITADGRAKLLDFAAPESDTFQAGRLAGNETSAATPGLFLKLVATSALRGRFGDPTKTAPTSLIPLPLHASRFLETLEPDADLTQAQAALRTLLPLPPRISRARRALLLAGALAFPILAAGLAGGISTLKRNLLNAAPELATLNECLTHYDQFKHEASSHEIAHSEDIDAFETYIAGRFAQLITNSAQWDNPVTKAVIPSPLREEAEQILKRKTSPGTAELTAASAKVEQFFKKPPELAAREALQQPNMFLGALAVGYTIAIIVAIIPCLVASLLFRGGALVALLGIVFVNRESVPVSRWRVTARNLVAWLPFVLIPATSRIHETLPFVVGVGVLFLAGISLLLPKRGLQDRLTGTWPVPR